VTIDRTSGFALPLASEQLAHAFFNTPTVGVAVFDADLRYQAINEALGDMNGVPAKAHIGRTIRDVLGDMSGVIEKHLRRVRATGAPRLGVGITLKLATRSEIGHWIGSYFPLSDRTEKVTQVAAVVVEVTRQKQAEDSLRRVAGQLTRARTDERRRIARDVHDSINQYHGALRMTLARLGRPGCTTARRVALLRQSVEILDECIAETRTISRLLHPPLVQEGFASTVRWYVEGFADRSGIRATLDVSRNLSRVPRPVQLALFRVLQEGLTNVHRHSGASAVDVSVRIGRDRVTLEIQDDGRGMPRARLRRIRNARTSTSVGLTGIQERIEELRGTLEVRSGARGTILRASVPLSPELK